MIMESIKRFIGTKLKLDGKEITILLFDFENNKVNIHWTESNKRTKRELKSVLKELNLTQEEKEYYNISFYSKKNNKNTDNNESDKEQTKETLKELIFEKI